MSTTKEPFSNTNFKSKYPLNAITIYNMKFGKKADQSHYEIGEKKNRSLEHKLEQ